MLYTKRKEDIEKALEWLRSSEVCFDDGSFASIRRGPMITTVIYYLQHHLGYKDGVSLEELKAFLYCMLLSEINKWEKTVKAIAWCPIEQTLEEISGHVIKVHNGKFIVDPEKVVGNSGIPPYWRALEPVVLSAKKICNDILNPPNERIEKLLSQPPQSLQKDPEMEEYLSRIRYEINHETPSRLEKNRKDQPSFENKPMPKVWSRQNDLKKFVKPEGITAQEVLREYSDPDILRDIEKAYEIAWQKEKLLYGEGYIKFLVSMAEYYLEEHSMRLRSELARLLDEIFGSNTRKKAAEYYIKAARIATEISLIYFPKLNYPEEAEKYLKLAVDLEEKAIELGFTPEYHSITLNNLGTHYYETNRPREALRVLKKALKYASTPDEKGLILHNLALTYADLGMKTEAVESMVKSICIHYAAQHDFGDVSLYDDGINRIIEMTGDPNTDIQALRIALDFIGGNLNATEAVEYLQRINTSKWPLSKALLRALTDGDVSLPDSVSECKKLLENVTKAREHTARRSMGVKD
ncbi:hypothetical protein A3L08_08690 [Thermococcus pacificus]|uniref:Uncharacterized protein n=2 Tax=Thermococcus pacificus TaxID=71998 RepID=A0A218P9E3_9EURY|nr:hypothetical protein A3L08_08690 [Thermococcus pacificus]